MKPCAHIEALEAHALGDGAGAGDAWLEAHVAECADCTAELERLLEERALFTRRAVAQQAADAPPDVATVFAELDRRRERFRKIGVLASLVAAAAACVAMAFTPQVHQAMQSSGGGWRAMAEPLAAERGATASIDDLQMSMRVAACMPGHDALMSPCDAPAGALPPETNDTHEVLAMTSSGAGGTSGGSWWPSACVPDVTCSVAGP